MTNAYVDILSVSNKFSVQFNDVSIASLKYSDNHNGLADRTFGFLRTAWVLVVGGMGTTNFYINNETLPGTYSIAAVTSSKIVTIGPTGTGATTDNSYLMRNLRIFDEYNSPGRMASIGRQAEIPYDISIALQYDMSEGFGTTLNS